MNINNFSRFIVITIFIFLLFFKSSISQDNDKWVLFGTTDYQYLYYDNTSLDIDSTEGTVTFYYKNEFFTPEYNISLRDKLKYTIYKCKISCKLKQFAFLSGVDYYSSGFTSSRTYEENYSYFKSLDQLYPMICK